MKNADVLVIEDQPNIRELVRFWLDRSGHTVTHEATTLPEALQAVEAIAIGEIACDVMVLDGNLGNPATHEDDARMIMSKIDEYHLGLKVIGFSSAEKLSDRGLPVDVDIDKLDKNAFGQLADRITEF